MRVRSLIVGHALLLVGVAVVALAPLWGQDAAPPPPPVPVGVEVMARGPVHEAFAPLAADPVSTKTVAKKPPAPLEEMPPEEKPAGDVTWISGYWAFDDDRADFLWVSGVWRAPPPGRQWIAGYWREEGDAWQWVPGFWTTSAPAAPAAPAARGAAPEEAPVQQVTYLPQPPVPPAMAPPGVAPEPDSFFVPGTWAWNGSTYVWRAGYWARRQPNYVWVSDHYRWTPSGCVYIPGYWDLAVSRRGLLYAPVVITPGVVRVGWTYTPAYAVRDTVVVDALFVRPSYCHYYFGDYYAVGYRGMGYESCYVYSQRRYDSIVVYETYERRSNPAWLTLQINVYNDRCAGRAPCPPRTLVETNAYVRLHGGGGANITMIAEPRHVVAARGVVLVKVDVATRMQARQHALAVQHVALQRTRTEVALRPGAPRVARVGALSVPRAQTVRPGMVAARMPTLPAHAPAHTEAHKAPPGHGPAGPGHPVASPRPGTVPPAGTHPGTTAPGTRPAPGRPVPPAHRPPPKDKKDSK